MTSNISVGCQPLTYKTLFDTIRVHVHKNGLVPCQLSFDSSNVKSTNFLNATYDLHSTNTLIRELGLPVFIHSTCCFNPSNPIIISQIQNDLTLVSSIGGIGVVIHVGKSCDRSTPEQALDIMKTTILQCIQHATTQTSLILETPAGQGTELCSTFEEFVSFYMSFTSDDRKRFKVCIDTQHVFARGYDPFVYIQTFIQTCGREALACIHLNDSASLCGLRLDRHAGIGCGNIGLQKLIEIAQYASQLSIPLINE